MGFAFELRPQGRCRRRKTGKGGSRSSGAQDTGEGRRRARNRNSLSSYCYLGDEKEGKEQAGHQLHGDIYKAVGRAIQTQRGSQRHEERRRSSEAPRAVSGPAPLHLKTGTLCGRNSSLTTRAAKATPSSVSLPRPRHGVWHFLSPTSFDLL